MPAVLDDFGCNVFCTTELSAELVHQRENAHTLSTHKRIGSQIGRARFSVDQRNLKHRDQYDIVGFEMQLTPLGSSCMIVAARPPGDPDCLAKSKSESMM
jgi:hypothetical protein